MFTPAEAAEIVAAAGATRLAESISPPAALTYEQVVDLGGEFGLARQEIAAAHDSWLARRNPKRSEADHGWFYWLFHLGRDIDSDGMPMLAGPYFWVGCFCWGPAIWGVLHSAEAPHPLAVFVLSIMGLCLPVVVWGVSVFYRLVVFDARRPNQPFLLLRPASR